MMRLRLGSVFCLLAVIGLSASAPRANAVPKERLEALKAGASPKDLKDLEALQARFHAVSLPALRATVALRIGPGSGSGVIISEDGYVLTAGHVSGEAGRTVTAILHDGSKLKGKTLGANFGIDSGMIKLEPEARKLPFVRMGDASDLKTGAWCMALGHSGGHQAGRDAPVRVGRVLFNRSSGIMTDCALVGGDSGGPLFDLDGKVIGINSRIGGSLKANIHVPINTYQETWERLKKGEIWGDRGLRPGMPFLGVGPDPETPKALIGQVVKGSAAEEGGIEVGDLVIKIDKKEIKTFEALVETVRKKKPGQSIKVRLIRDGKEIEKTIKLGKFNPRPNP